MAIYKVRNLGKMGVVTDIPPYDLPMEAWTDAKNIRFVANRVEKMGGYTPAMIPTGDNHIPLVFCQEPESSAIIYGTQKNIYRYVGAQNKVISKVRDAYNVTVANPWNYTILSNCVIFNDPSNVPQGWLAGQAADSTKLMQDLPGWGKPTQATTTPEAWSAASIKAYKNYLIALNMKEANKNYPQRIRWSDVADVNAFPPNWYQDSATSDGGFVDLSDCTGNIIDGRPLRDYFLVYTDRETFIMRYVGGDFVFDIQKLFPDSGVLNANCIAEFEGGQHFVISQDDIFTHDGSSRQSIVTDIIKEKLLGEITSVNYQGTKVFPFPTRKEIWITYPSQAAMEGSDKNYACDKAAVWNWKTGAWSFTDLPGTLWMSEVSSPDADIRAWMAPDRSGSKPIKPITKIILDSPIYSLAVDDSFRIDVIYQPGEGLRGNETISWDTDNHAIAQFDPPDIDGSAFIRAKAPGTVKMTAHYTRAAVGTSGQPGYVPAADSSDTYTITITAKGTKPGDRHQASDDPAVRDSDPNEPIPNRNGNATPPVGPYRPDQPADQSNTWPDPEATPPNSNSHDSEQWEKKGYSFSSRAFISCSEDTNFYFMDTGTRQIRNNNASDIVSNTPVISEITKYGVSFSDVEDGLYRHKTFRTIYPLISGEGTLRFNIGGSNDAYDMPTVNESKTFVIGKDYKIDCFTNYRYLSYSIRDEGEGKWSFSGMDIDYFLGGNR